MLLLLEDTQSEGVINGMAGYSGDVVTLTVGDDLSGEIAQYTEGAVTDAAGDVVAGESAVATDAAGDVVAASDVAGAVGDASTPKASS